jgi:hypothetical protein
MTARIKGKLRRGIQGIPGAQGPSGPPPDGNKGDIVVSDAGVTWTIAAGSVLNTKLNGMPEATIKGRAAGAGTGSPQDLTATQARAAMGVSEATLDARYVQSVSGTGSNLTSQTGAGPAAIALTLTESSDATSARAAARFGDWIVGQDLALTGAKDFFLFDIETGTTPARFGASGADTVKRFRPRSIFNSGGDASADVSALGPFGSHRAPNVIQEVFTGTRAFADNALAIMMTADGSGTNGPATSFSSLFISGQKSSYLTSDVEGEISSLKIANYQGRRGDAASALFVSQKVKGTGTDTGGITTTEHSTRWVNTSGTITWQNQVVVGFGESAAGLSGGKGYGVFSEQRVGTVYALFYGGNFDEGGGSPIHENLLVGSSGRNAVDPYVRIAGPSGGIGGSYLWQRNVAGVNQTVSWIEASMTNYTTTMLINDVGFGFRTTAGTVFAGFQKAGFVNAVDDAAAATAGCPVGYIYRNGSILRVRVT